MHTSLLDVLRCPFCGTALEMVEGDALAVVGDEIHAGVLGCACCAYPIVDGIPVLLADDATRAAMHALEAGRADEALLALLGLGDDAERADRVRTLIGREDATYREGLELLCDDAEGTWFLYHFSDPTYVTAEALLRAVAGMGWPVEGRVLDLCGGSGHLTRALMGARAADNGPAPGQPADGPTEAGPQTVLADLFFWKLWLGKRYVVPGAEAICCDANHPLPFARDTFSTVLLADAFPYVWHKRLLAEEMMRLAGERGVVIMPHLHSALGDNFSAGDTLPPAAYRGLFEPLGARLFSDERLLDDVLERRCVDLGRDASPEELGDQSSLTLIATRRTDLFRRHDVPPAEQVRGALLVNPLYRIERNGRSTTLTLEFPSPEYEAEFGASRRYLPERLTLDGDLGGPITADMLGARYGELRDRRVILDAPERYCR